MLDDGNDPMVQLLPEFLALFSSLEKVNLNQQLCVAQRANLKGCKDVFKKILSACPRVKTIPINFSVVDLAFLEVSPTPHIILYGGYVGIDVSPVTALPGSVP